MTSVPTYEQEEQFKHDLAPYGGDAHIICGGALVLMKRFDA
jgi:hypothetical protein